MTVGTDARLFSVRLFKEPWLVLVVTPAAEAMFSVAAPAAATVRLNTSIPVALTLAVELLRLAFRVSVPSPPTRTSPLLRELLVVASKVSFPAAPVKVFTPVVSAKVCAWVLGSTSSLVIVPVAVTEAVRLEPEKVTVKVSSASKALSSVVAIVRNCVV